VTLKAQCVGGPYDGAELAVPLFEFTWVDGKRNFRDQAPGRALYLKKRNRFESPVLVYVQNAYVRCPHCEVYHSRCTNECSLCGTNLAEHVREDFAG
jgi:hypothetical protein